MPESLIVAWTAFAAENVVAAFVIRTLASFAISAMLSPRQKSNPAGAAPLVDQSRTLTLNQPAAPWEIVYGTVRKGGRYVFRHVTKGGPTQVYTETHVIPATAPYTITTWSADWVSLGSVDFIDTEHDINDNLVYEYTPLALNVTPGAGEYYSSSSAYTFNADDAGKSVRITFNGRSVAATEKYLHQVIVLAAHEVEEIGDIYFDDEVVALEADGSASQSSKYYGHVYISKHLGTATQTVDVSLNASVPDKWTSAHRLQGHAYIYVWLKRNIDIFPGGVPNISAVIKGKKVFDPRSSTTVWSANAALCVADYMNSDTVGLGATYSTEIEDAELIAAANVCDENVTLASGSTEDRYTCNGVVSTADKPGEIIGRMLGAMAGRAVYLNGTWRIHAGAYVAPTITFDEGDFRGPVRVATRLSRRDAFNGVKGVFVSPDNHWQPTDFAGIASATYMAEDNNERIWKDIELPFTTSSATAQRLAKIELLRSRQQITVNAPLKLTGYKAEPPDVVGLTFAKFGWTAKAFEIAELKLQFGETLGVDLALRETASTVYDWTASEESPIDSAPNTNLPNPFVVGAPGAPEVTETIYELFGFGVKVKALVSWAAAADAQAYRYDLQWKKREDIVWSEQSGISSLNAEVLDVEDGAYLFRVRAISAIGVASLWAQTEKTFVGLTDPPGNVSGFSVIKSTGFALAQWTPTVDLDVRVGGNVVIRHSPLTSGATWENGVILDTFPGSLVQGTVSLITGTYMAKFIDSSGNYSSTMASFVVTEGMITGFTTVGTTTQAPGFTGAKTNVVLDGALGGLKLDSTTLIDDMVTSVDDWPFIDGIGGVSATGSYAFDTYLDLATVATRRFETDITALSYDTGDVIDSRLDNIDDWDSIDGGTINDCDVTLYARTTNDDPAGTPTWGAWTPFWVADFTCRALQFKLDFVSGSATHNIVVTALTVHAKEAA